MGERGAVTTPNKIKLPHIQHLAANTVHNDLHHAAWYITEQVTKTHNVRDKSDGAESKRSVTNLNITKKRKAGSDVTKYTYSLN
jgi:hypothetical protein